MKQLQFHCEVSRKDRSQAVEDKAERGLASPAFLLTCYAVLNLIKYTTQPNTLLVPCWRKKKEKVEGQSNWRGGLEDVDVKKVHCVYAEQPDSGKHVEHNLCFPSPG